MKIYPKKTLPLKQTIRDCSMHVFIYYTNNTRFTFGYYDYHFDVWVDNDGNVIDEDFMWCYLPIKKFKEYIRRWKYGKE